MPTLGRTELRWPAGGVRPPDDIAALGFSDGDLVDIISEWEDGEERRAPAFRVVSYATPHDSADGKHGGSPSAGNALGSDQGHKARSQPRHLS